MKGKHHKGKKSPIYALETNVRERKNDGVIIFLGQNGEKAAQQNDKKKKSEGEEREREEMKTYEDEELSTQKLGKHKF